MKIIANPTTPIAICFFRTKLTNNCVANAMLTLLRSGF